MAPNYRLIVCLIEPNTTDPTDNVPPISDDNVLIPLNNCDTPLETLQEIFETDPDGGGQANALLKNVEEFNFVFDLLLLRRVLAQCELLPKTLQSSSVTYEVVKSVTNRTQVLRSFRTDYFFTKFFNRCTEIANKCGFKAADLPRKGKLPSKTGGGSKAPFESAEQYYKDSNELCIPRQVDSPYQS
ncbi:hypothetical protein HUJ05_013203 [Dendroctonus ponderosae]|nr:hypothetical protein HUJ05_013203 [Dendroctonus ponderosae]